MHAEKEELDTPAIVTIGIVASVLVFVIIVLLQAYFAEAQRQEWQRKVVAPRSEELVAAQSDQETQLNTWRWIDRANGVVAVPIARAMELVARELPSRPAGPAPAPASPTHAPPAGHGGGH